MNSITLRAPATIANLSCGFDVLGLCVKNPFDEIRITKSNDCNVVINIQDSPFSDIPDDPNQNTGGIPAQLIINQFNLDFGFNIDEKFHRSNGFYWLKYIANYFNFEKLALLSDQKLNEIQGFALSDINHFNKYGIIFDVPAAYIEILFK